MWKKQVLFIGTQAVRMLLLTFLAGALWIGANGVLALAATVAGYGCCMAWAVHTLKGVSGDLAGFALCAGELFGLAAMAVLNA